MRIEEITLSKERNVTLTVYLNQDSPESKIEKRPLIVVLPGGGYAMCSAREAENVALKYMAEGFQAAVLRYTLKDKGGWPYPLNDYEEAMALIEDHAKEWRIDMDRTAVVGFSAGGHLAACVATMAIHRPKAAILVYAAVLPGIVDACEPGLPYPIEYIDSDTVPCFLVAARDDGLVNVSNSLCFATALEKAGINFELHIYSYGQHGFATGTPDIINFPATDRLANWVPESISWLWEILGKLTTQGMGEPVIPPTLNSNGDEFLSVDCTLSHLKKQGETVQHILGAAYAAFHVIAEQQGVEYESIFEFLGNMTVRGVLQMVNMPEDRIQQLDEALRKIPNQKG